MKKLLIIATVVGVLYYYGKELLFVGAVLIGSLFPSSESESKDIDPTPESYWINQLSKDTTLTSDTTFLDVDTLNLK